MAEAEPVEIRMTDTTIECSIHTPDFNDLKDVERYYTEVSTALIDSGDERAKSTGLFLKNMAVGFIAALADAKRHGLNVEHQINSAPNAFVQLFAPMILASCDTDEQRSDATRVFSHGFVRMLTQFMADALNKPELSFDYYREHKDEMIKKALAKATGIDPTALWVNKPDRTVH